MEEQKDKKTCGCPCCCGSGMGNGAWHGHWHGHIILRILLAILIIGVAFWVGMRLGELRAEVYNAGYYGGRGMMRSYGYHGGYAPMMQNYSAPTPSAGSAPATNATK